MESTQTFAEGSVVGSLEGNVTLVAGQDLTVRGAGLPLTVMDTLVMHTSQRS